MGSGLSGALIQGLLQGRVAVVDDPEWMPGSERRYPCNCDGAVVWHAKGLTGCMFLSVDSELRGCPGNKLRRDGLAGMYHTPSRSSTHHEKAPIPELLCVAYYIQQKLCKTRESQLISPTAPAASQCCSTLARAQM